jgi:hypothetical protein
MDLQQPTAPFTCVSGFIKTKKGESKVPMF